MSSKKKRSPCPIVSAKKPSKRKKVSKDRADVLAASDRGSYFEQEKLISQNDSRISLIMSCLALSQFEVVTS